MSGWKSRRQPEPAAAGPTSQAMEGPFVAEDGEQEAAQERQSDTRMSESDEAPEPTPVPEPDYGKLADGTVDGRVGEARRALASGDVIHALHLYRALLLEYPRDVSLRTELGNLYTERSEFLLALEQFEAAKDAAPEDVGTMVLLANALAQVGRYDAAERELRKALRLDPARPEVHASMGIINFRRGVYGQAEQELKRAIDLDPSSAEAFHYRGESLNQLGRVDEALPMLERAAQLAPQHARTFYVMGIVFDKKGRPQEAAAMYRRAREIGRR